MGAGDIDARVWIETGGDTGLGEYYRSPGVRVAMLDWDDINDDPGSYTHDDYEYWLVEYADIMPKRTRKWLAQALRHAFAADDETEGGTDGT